MFIRYPSKRSHVPIRHLIPNAITTTALCCGLAAIHAALKGEWKDALLFIAAAALFDALDGRAARLLKATSSFGNVLDSLSDFLCFGVAPALILHQWMLKDQDWLGLLASMLFALCSALRLARFTAAIPAPVNLGPAAQAMHAKFFVGMPTPAAACAALIPVLLAVSKLRLELSPWVVIGSTILIALLMVSRQPMFSFKKLKIPRPIIVPLLVVIGLIVVGVRKDLWLTLACLSGAYVLSFPLALYQHHKLAKRAATEAHDPAAASVPSADPASTHPAPAHSAGSST